MKSKTPPNKKVRITLEVDSQFLRLLHCNIEMSRPVRGWLHGTDEAGEITPCQVLGLLVYMEGRGGTPEQIATATPFMWRPNVDVIHTERRVYQGDKQLSGPELIAATTEVARLTQQKVEAHETLTTDPFAAGNPRQYNPISPRQIRIDRGGR